jgi:hypothetical protein
VYAAVLLLGAAGAVPVRAQGPPIETFEPAQAPRGSETVFVAWGKKLKDVRGAEVTPSEGVTVKEVTELAKNRYAVTVLVEETAAPGERQLALTLKKGRSQAKTFQIPPHSPQLKDLVVHSTRPSGAVVEVSFTVFDEAGDLDEKPRVFTKLFCSDATLESSSPANSIQFSDPQNARVRHSSANPALAQFGQSITARGTCMLEVTLEDQPKYRSNRLVTPVTF